MFGSAVRGEIRPESDIDIMVEFEPGVCVGLIGRVGAEAAQTEGDSGKYSAKVIWVHWSQSRGSHGAGVPHVRPIGSGICALLEFGQRFGCITIATVQQRPPRRANLASG